MSDITYIPTAEGWLYLAVVIDLFSRCVLGWKLAETLHSELVTGAISHALDSGLVVPGAILHSDRGCQYSAALTRDLLNRAGLRQSMSTKGHCYDNVFAESAFASLKSELFIDGQPFASRRAAATAIFDYFECFYNRRHRRHALLRLAAWLRQAMILLANIVGSPFRPRTRTFPTVPRFQTAQPANGCFSTGC